MGIFRTTDPTQWNQVDGIIIDEVSPPPSIGGVPANIAILVGQFERGPAVLTEVGSVGEVYEIFGNNLGYSGQLALQNKKFGSLKIVRVVASDAAAGSKAFVSSSTSRITFNAKYKGIYGNSIQVKIEAGTTSGSKYTIHDSNSGAVWPDEVYDNVAVTMTVQQLTTIFGNSKLVGVPTINSSAAEPSTCALTSLTAGSDGTVADTDYQTAIGVQEIEAAGNILFLDAYNSTRRGYLKTSMANTTDRMALLCGLAGDSVATAITNVASCRDTDGRLIYAFPYVLSTIQGVQQTVQPCSFYAALLSQTAPNIDPAYAANSQYLAGIDGLEMALTRSNYISLMAAGISALENDADIGIKVKSGVVTQIVDTSKLMIFRRRMADYLTYSTAKFLKAYQNAPNSQENRIAAIAAIKNFNGKMELEKLVPKDSEVKSGKASLIDGDSLNTDSSIAAGYFKILWKRRIYSSMRFIVLQAEIGESVVVTEVQSA